MRVSYCISVAYFSLLACVEFICRISGVLLCGTPVNGTSSLAQELVGIVYLWPISFSLCVEFIVVLMEYCHLVH